MKILVKFNFSKIIIVGIISNTIDNIIEHVKVTVKVTINQQKILNAIRENPHITQEELAKIIGIPRKSINTNMKKHQKLGLIQRIGADKNGYWKVK